MHRGTILCINNFEEDCGLVTDAGMLVMGHGCYQLQCINLTGCHTVTDRYAYTSIHIHTYIYMHTNTQVYMFTFISLPTVWMSF